MDCWCISIGRQSLSTEKHQYPLTLLMPSQQIERVGLMTQSQHQGNRQITLYVHGAKTKDNTKTFPGNIMSNMLV